MKQNSIKILLTLILIFLIITTSFALWRYSFIGDSNTINKNSIKLEFLESNSNLIDITNSLPQTDFSGINGKSFDFQVKTETKDDIVIPYDLKIEKLNVESNYNSLNDSDIKIYLEDYSGNVLVNPVTIDKLYNNILYSNIDSHNAQNEVVIHKYKLRAWIDYDVDISNWTSRTKLEYKFKINVRTNNGVYNYNFTNNYQIFNAPISGNYKFELWGAQGQGITGGYGGYVSGNINLLKDEKLYVYVGSQDNEFNGGGIGYSPNKRGGGATDVRLNSGNWENNLTSRIIVAGAGAGSNATDLSRFTIGHAGGLEGYTGNDYYYTYYTSTGGTQTSGGIVNNYNSPYPLATNGSFGYGGIGGGAGSGGSYGGGSGYYGGAGGARLSNGNWIGGGGSSYISGHIGCVAIENENNASPKNGCNDGTTDIECSKHYSGKNFTDTIMIDGVGYEWTNVKGNSRQMPNPLGGYYPAGTGHIGNGFAKITYIN